MRIGWVTPTLGCFGAVREMIEVSNVLVELGHDVTIFSPQGDSCRWLPSQSSYGDFSALSKDALDVVIGIIDWKPALYDVLLSAPAKVRAVCVLGFTPSLELAAKLRGEQPIQDCSTLVFQRALNDPSMHILADGAWQLDWLRDNVRQDVGVAFGGVNMYMFHPPLPTKGRFGRRAHSCKIGYSGDVRERKGTDTVEKAVSILQKEYSTISFSTYWGKRYTQPELVRWYQDCDIFLDGHRRAGWCNPVMEAMACGCAVVCTSIPATTMVIEDGVNAKLVSVDDSDAMASVVEWLVCHPEQIESLSEQAVSSAKKYDYHQVVTNLERYLLEEVS